LLLLAYPDFMARWGYSGKLHAVVFPIYVVCFFGFSNEPCYDFFCISLSLSICREPRGFGFVQYVDPADAAEAKYHMDGYVLLGW